MAYNEADNLSIVIDEFESFLTQLSNPYEIIIIDDGSTDGTREVADMLGITKTNLRVIHHDNNQGLGFVYHHGFYEACLDLITFFPADGQFPANIILQFLPMMEQYDLALGYIPQKEKPLFSNILSKAESAFYWILFGNLPKLQGVFMLRRPLLNEIQLKSTGRGWTILIELILRTIETNHRIVNIPIAMRKRISGHSKVNNMPTIWSNLKQAIALRFYI